MSLKEEIDAIVSSEELSYDIKRKMLLKLVTPSEVVALLPKQYEQIKLKPPRQPKTINAEISNLNLSVIDPIFNSIIEGNHIECRIFNEYFKNRCSYVENGVMYLIPFETVTFFVGKGERAKWAKLAVKDIVCDGECIYFHLGQVIDKYNV